MPDDGRGFPDPELDKALEVLCPPHPNRSDKLVLRAGRTQTSEYVFFEAHRGREKPTDRWLTFRPMTIEERVAFEEFYERERENLNPHLSKAHHTLYYHERE